MDAWVWVSRPPNGSGGTDLGGARGAPARRPRGRGHGRRVRADGRPRDGAARHPGPPRRDALEAAAGLRRPCSSTSPPRTSSGAAPRSAGGRARSTPSPRRSAGLVRPRPAPPRARRGDDVVDGRGARAGARLEARPAGDPARALRPRAAGARAGRAGGRDGAARLAVAGARLRGDGLRRGAGRPRARPVRRRRRLRSSPRPRRARPSRRTPRAPRGCCSLRRAGRLGAATVVGEGLGRGGGSAAPRPGCSTWRPSSTPPSGPRPSARTRARSPPTSPALWHVGPRGPRRA